jgi:hypothetical protein
MERCNPLRRISPEVLQRPNAAPPLAYGLAFLGDDGWAPRRSLRRDRGRRLAVLFLSDAGRSRHTVFLSQRPFPLTVSHVEMVP